jgi:hypothetical protein
MHTVILYEQFINCYPLSIATTTIINFIVYKFKNLMKKNKMSTLTLELLI